MICAKCAQQVATGARRCPACESDPPRDAVALEQARRVQHHPWTKPIESARLDHRHAHLVRRPQPIAPRPSTSARTKVPDGPDVRDGSSVPDGSGVPSGPSGPDVPIMRPEDLSRELSQAHHATVALGHQQRTNIALARALLVLVTAVIAGLATYLALAP